MAILGAALSGGRVSCPSAPEIPIEALLARALRQLPGEAPVAVLVHGYKYSPNRPASDPGRTLYSAAPSSPRPRLASWPLGLGFRDGGLRDGLCIGFAWPAEARDHAGRCVARFARVYEAAGLAGRALAGLLDAIAGIAPDRPLHLLAHSLGARVALQSARQARAARLGQVILLGGAEYRANAMAALGARAFEGAQLYNVISRENDVFDFLFQRFGPRGRKGGGPLGDGLGANARHCFDLPLDRPEILPVLRRRGVALEGSVRRVCHWNFYTRPGAFDLYREIIRAPHNWRVADLKAEAGTIPRGPRWSLLLPRSPDPGAGGAAPVTGT